MTLAFRLTVREGWQRTALWNDSQQKTGGPARGLLLSPPRSPQPSHCQKRSTLEILLTSSNEPRDTLMTGSTAHCILQLCFNIACGYSGTGGMLFFSENPA